MLCADGHANPDEAAYCMTCGKPLSVTSVPLSDEGGGTSPGTYADPDALAEPPVVGDVRSDGTSTTPSKKLVMVGLGVLLAIAFAVAVVINRQTPEDRYLAALDDAGLSNQFTTVPAALRSAQDVCASINDGGDPVGNEADLVGVENLCPEWAENFDVLRVEDIDAEFRLVDADGYRDGARGCEGDGGYGDISASTSYVVTNLEGDILTRGSLGTGEVVGGDCVFSWTFEVTEGEDAYVVAVGDRGELDYSFEELATLGVALSLGD